MEVGYSATFGLDQASGLGTSSACLPDTGRMWAAVSAVSKVGQRTRTRPTLHLLLVIVIILCPQADYVRRQGTLRRATRRDTPAPAVRSAACYTNSHCFPLQRPRTGYGHL
jgi:hypothetical protein